MVTKAKLPKNPGQFNTHKKREDDHLFHHMLLIILKMEYVVGRMFVM